MNSWSRFGMIGIPALVILVGISSVFLLTRVDRAVKVNDAGVPVQPTPKWEMPGYRQPAPPVPVPPKPGQEQAYPGRNNKPPDPVANPASVPVPSGVFRSLDKINAAAARVGCETLKPNDPATKLIDVAECLGERAVPPTDLTVKPGVLVAPGHTK